MALLETASALKGLVLLLGGGGTTAAFFKYLNLREDNRRKKEAEEFQAKLAMYSYDKLIERKTAINLSLMGIVAETNASRAMVCRIENGGKLANIGSPLYISIVEEAFEKGETQITSKWDKQRIDAEYQVSIRKLILAPDKRMEIFQGDLTEGPIKNGYILHKVHHAQYYEIAQPPGIYFYLAITYKDDKPETIDQIEAKRVHVTKIQNLYEQEFKDLIVVRSMFETKENN
jgi:hypothetical protein